MNTTKEFETLRNEIIESDKMCVGILAFSSTFSATLLGIENVHLFQMKELLILVEIVWLMSYFYITNKRFAILTIANYIIEDLEPKTDLNLNWESWLRKTTIPRPIDIYLVETITCIIPIVLISLYSSLFDEGIWLKIITFTPLMVFIFFFIKNLTNYNKLHKLIKLKSKESYK